MSDLGSLSECLVDNDPAARVRARRLRSKALVLSVALEAIMLSRAVPLASDCAGSSHRALHRDSRAALLWCRCGARTAVSAEPFAQSTSNRVSDRRFVSPFASGGSSVGAGK